MKIEEVILGVDTHLNLHVGALISNSGKCLETLSVTTDAAGYLRLIAWARSVKLRGLEKVDWLFVFSCAAHNLIRLPKLIAQPPAMTREQCA
jgi:hypothetical protein